MRRKPLFIFLLIMIAGAFTNCEAKNKKITITVLDRKTGTPVEFAVVHMITMKSDYITVIPDSCVTNGKGECRFSVATGEGYGYTVSVRKKDYYQCFSTDPENAFISYRSFSGTPAGKIRLYLDPDSTSLMAYYRSMMPHIRIDSLVMQLKSDQYGIRTGRVMPDLAWTDIPDLLEIGNDRVVITHFPVNPVSSSYQEECYLGIVALWLIESVRITCGNPLMNPVNRYPSMNPLLRDKSEEQVNSGRKQNTPEMMEAAFEAYRSWWENTKQKDIKEACRVNPLEGTGLSW